MEVIPEQGDHGHNDGDPTDPKSSVDQIVILHIVQFFGQHVFDCIVLEFKKYL